MLDISIFEHDHFLSPLFNKERVLWEMWVMDLGKSSAVNLQLIYSLITLSDSGADSTNWRTSDFKPLFSSTLAEYVIPRIAKCSVNSNGNIVSSIIKSLLSGTTLGDACTANGAIVPPERFKNLSLGSRNEIERSFVIGHHSVAL